MAFLRKGINSEQEVENLVDINEEPSPILSGGLETRLLEQNQGKIVDNRQNGSSIAFRQVVYFTLFWVQPLFMFEN